VFKFDLTKSVVGSRNQRYSVSEADQRFNYHIGSSSFPKWNGTAGKILLAAGWYLRFSVSYRDVEELLAERGLLVDHVTVWRWVQSYAPASGRNLHPGQRRVALPLSGSGLFRCDNRLSDDYRFHQDA
jgi:hypothetical protein